MIKKKVAVVLFNLGGPSNKNDIEEFLFNLFYDKNILAIQNPLRWLIAFIISKLRVKKATEIYGYLGGGSPILSETQKQAAFLESTLNEYSFETEFKCFVAMRYFHPFSREVIKDIKIYNPEEVLLLPLYPQFSSTTTKSSVENFHENMQKEGYKVKTKTLCCYPDAKKFIESHLKILKEVYAEAISKGNCRIIFSAHSLPEKIINKGDPYQWQVERAVKSIIDLMSEQYKDIDWVLAYQSKVGYGKWLQPSITDVITAAAISKMQVIIVPITFVSEHSETLVELDIMYRDMAMQKGCPKYYRIPALSVNKIFIEFLAEMCIYLAGIVTDCDTMVVSSAGQRLCPINYKLCINN